MIPGLHKIAAMMLCTCEVGFSAMSATALIPLTCYTHPNKLKSLLKYPNVICGSDTHGAMLAVGLCLLILLADPRCLRLPGFVHLWGLHGTNMECLRETRPCPRFPIPGLPIPAGDLAFISFCGDFDFSRHKFPMKGQCLGSGFLLICSSCP